MCETYSKSLGLSFSTPSKFAKPVTQIVRDQTVGSFEVCIRGYNCARMILRALKRGSGRHISKSLNFGPYKAEDDVDDAIVDYVES